MWHDWQGQFAIFWKRAEKMTTAANPNSHQRRAAPGTRARITQISPRKRALDFWLPNRISPGNASLTCYLYHADRQYHALLDFTHYASRLLKRKNPRRATGSLSEFHSSTTRDQR
jgi:hypothetical protein